MEFLRTPAFRGFALLGFALAWRLILFVGPQGSDDLAYSEAAWEVASGQYRPQAGIHGLRLGYVGGIGLIYALFGAGSFSLVVLNLACSVAEVGLVLLVARELTDGPTAWRAAGLVALLPAHVFYATEAHPDVPVATLSLLSAYLFLRGLRKDSAARLGGAGLALGAAHLFKESAFFGLAALAVLAGRPRRLHLWTVAGFLIVPAVEAVFFAATTGDPLFRLRSAGGGQAEIMGSTLYQEQVPTLRRLFVDVPAMLFWPASGDFPYYALLPAAAAVGAGFAFRSAEGAPLRKVVFWTLVLIALLNFWPGRLWPYRPAMVAHPRIFLVCAGPLAILAAWLLGRLPRKTAWTVAGLAVAASLACATVLHSDGRQFSEGARLAFDRLPPGADAVVSDPRTAGFFRLFDGYRRTRPWLPWDETPREGSYVRVVNAGWMRRLTDWYGVRPPPPFESEGGEELFSASTRGRLRWRSVLTGRPQRIGGEPVRIDRVSRRP